LNVKGKVVGAIASVVNSVAGNARRVSRDLTGAIEDFTTVIATQDSPPGLIEGAAYHRRNALDELRGRKGPFVDDDAVEMKESDMTEHSTANRRNNRATARHQPTDNDGLVARPGAAAEFLGTEPQVLSAIGKMSVVEVIDLVRALEEQFGVPAAMAPMASPAALGPGFQEQTEFNLVLSDVGADKVSVMKAVREITGLGLKESKDVVDGAPKVVKEAMPKAEAEAGKKILEDAGARAELT
jgi:large subunit ribosomal protein L7/L12